MVRSEFLFTLIGETFANFANFANFTLFRESLSREIFAIFPIRESLSSKLRFFFLRFYLQFHIFLAAKILIYFKAYIHIYKGGEDYLPRVILKTLFFL